MSRNQPNTLTDLFSWDPSSGVAPEFLAAFEDIPYVIADETAFSALIDELEGLDLNGAHLQGNQVVAVMRTLYGNPRGSLTSQEQFLIAIGGKAAADAANVDLNRLLELIPGHAFTSVPPQDLLTTYLRLQPLDPGSILVWAPDQAANTCVGSGADRSSTPIIKTDSLGITSRVSTGSEDDSPPSKTVSRPAAKKDAMIRTTTKGRRWLDIGFRNCA